MRIKRWLGRAAAMVLGLAVVAVAIGWAWLALSLPRLDGTRALAGLRGEARIERDADGTVTIDAASEADAMRALGYVHAQERYFEMDLMRRDAAGELSALFGARALPRDRERRVHRLRARAQARMGAYAGDAAPVLDAYVAGANAGLADLRARPWPYLLLRARPAAWTPSDSALVGYAMYFDLQDAKNTRERGLRALRGAVPPALFALAAHDGAAWEAPLMGMPRGDARLPDAATLDLRRLPMPREDAPLRQHRAIGSNNFAVGAAATRDGRAIVADDMHLGLRAPNIWFRVRLRYADARAPGGRVDVTGVSLPGLPAVVVGSNGHVAWGFTNGYVDTMDVRRERPCEPQPVPGCVRMALHRERIEVAGGDAETLDVHESAWGPVIDVNADGTVDTLRWAAHLPGGMNMALAGLARAASLDNALRISETVAIPAQNVLLGDRAGRIAWRLTGALPDRTGACARAVAPGAAVASDCTPWGVRTAGLPRVVDPSSARLWTANNRVADGAALAMLGDAGYAQGTRALQIRQWLHGKPVLSERDLLAIQLDDRAWMAARWWRILQGAASRTQTPALDALAQAAPSAPRRASVDSAEYRIVRAWRQAVHARIAAGLLAPARAAGAFEDVDAPGLPQLEGVAWPLVQLRPAHLVPRRFARCTDTSQRCGTQSWDALFEDAAAEVQGELARRGPLRERTWGERNTTAICHPLAGAIPLIGKRALCMPAQPLPGDAGLPRVQGPDFGASQRMVVSPGREVEGYFHMPGGQSGHPLSPYWGAGHDDWAAGRASPFLPGKAEHVLVLR